MLRPSGWWLAISPVDLRCGMDRLLVLVQTQLGRDGFDGGAYVFRNRSGTRLNLCALTRTACGFARGGCTRGRLFGRVRMRGCLA